MGTQVNLVRVAGGELAKKDCRRLWKSVDKASLEGSFVDEAGLSLLVLTEGAVLDPALEALSGDFPEAEISCFRIAPGGAGVAEYGLWTQGKASERQSLSGMPVHMLGDLMAGRFA